MLEDLSHMQLVFNIKVATRILGMSGSHICALSLPFANKILTGCHVWSNPKKKGGDRFRRLV
jgi:hypothetical protein